MSAAIHVVGSIAAVAGVALVVARFSRLVRFRRVVRLFDANHDEFIEAFRRGDLDAAAEITRRGKALVAEARRLARA